MTERHLTIQHSRRIAIPKDLMEKYALKIGDIVIVEDILPNYGIKIIPAKVVPKDLSDYRKF